MSKPLNADQLFNAALKLLCERPGDFITADQAITAVIDLRRRVDIAVLPAEVPANNPAPGAPLDIQP